MAAACAAQKRRVKPNATADAARQMRAAGAERKILQGGHSAAPDTARLIDG